MKAEQARESDHDVDAAFAAAEDVACQRKTGQHDDRDQARKHPRRPGATTRQFGQEPDALPQHLGALGDCCGPIALNAHGLPDRLRIVERPRFFDQLHRFGDDRVLERRARHNGIQRLP